MRLIIILGFLSLPLLSVSQGEMLLLKKNNKVFRTYYAGSSIILDEGRGLQQAQIRRLRNDSVFLVQYQVRQVMTIMGVPGLDTVGTYEFGISYSDILKIAEAPHGWTWQGTGASLFYGGGILTTAGLLTWVFAKKNTRYYARPGFVIASAGATGIGYLLMQVRAGKRFPIGKKYTLEFINTK